MPACHAGDRRFDPGRDRHLILNSEPILGINSGIGFFVYRILRFNKYILLKKK